MAKKYAECLSDDEKVQKSLTEMVRHACMDWKRHNILIDSAKVSLIIKNIQNIELADDAKKLILASLAMTRAWERMFSVIVGNELHLVTDLLVEGLHTSEFKHQILSNLITFLASSTDVDSIIAVAISKNPQPEVVARALKAIVKDQYEFHRRTKPLTFNKTISFCVDFIVAEKSYLEGKYISSFINLLVDAPDFEFVATCFGQYKWQFVNTIVFRVLTEYYSWRSHNVLTFLLQSSQSFTEAVRQYVCQFASGVNGPLTVTFVEATQKLECSELKEVYTTFLLRVSSHGFVNLKKEMIAALYQFDPTTATEILCKLLRDESVMVRKEAASFLGKIGTQRALSILAEAERIAEGSEIPSIKSAIKAINRKSQK